MRSSFLFALMLVTGCRERDAPAPLAVSSCQEQRFDGSSFTTCSGRGLKIEVRGGARSFAALANGLGDRANTISFAMNAGMFDEAGQPIGLMIEDGRQVHAINRREGGGNFHLMPNGVFLVRDSGRAEVVTNAAFTPAADIAFATQSGPMLVVDGKLHPRFDHDGQSRYVRNGVGIAPNGEPLFVMTVDAVSLGKLARFYRDRLKVREALYFDGSVSSLWDPANGRQDNFTDLGPMVVAFRPAAGSAPDREGRATP